MVFDGSNEKPNHANMTLLPVPLNLEKNSIMVGSCLGERQHWRGQLFCLPTVEMAASVVHMLRGGTISYKRARWVRGVIAVYELTSPQNTPRYLHHTLAHAIAFFHFVCMIKWHDALGMRWPPMCTRFEVCCLVGKRHGYFVQEQYGALLPSWGSRCLW